MKKNYIILAAIVVAMFLGSTVKAQEEELQTSTAGAPIWYNMNCAGTSNAAVKNAAIAQFTHPVNGEIAKGQSPTPPTTKLATQNQDKFLWRFESDGAGSVYIINKFSNQQFTYPATAELKSPPLMFTMTAVGSLFTPTAVANITSNDVSGTAFYFTPTDAAYAAVGRVNCEGTFAELSLWKPGGGGVGDIGPGGKGSLYRLYLVPMKSVTVSVSAASTSTGTVAIMKDDATTPEEVNVVSKAQSIGVTVVAIATTGQFVEWRNVVTGLAVAETATYTYTDDADIQLEAVFDIPSSVGQVSMAAGVYPNPFKNSLQVESAVQGSKISIFDLSGREVLSSFSSSINTSKLETGSYILKFNSAEGIKAMKVSKQ